MNDMETPEERANDPAWQAVDEAGGGEQEGFEQSEELLRENAENAEHSTALPMHRFPSRCGSAFVSSLG